MNKNPSCPKCRSEKTVKNGKVKEKQRFKCKECGYQFTKCTLPGRSPQEKALAIILYTVGLSMNVIAEIIGVTPPAILYWIRDFSKKHYEKPKPGEAIIVELDEMWHYINKKKENSGYGKHIKEKLESLSIGNVEDAINKLFKN